MTNRTYAIPLGPPRPRGIAVLCLVALAAVACAPQSPAESTGPTPPRATTPLERLADAYSKKMIELQPRVEQNIRTCMRDRGFEYVPFDDLASENESAAPAEAELRDTRGYGISLPFAPETEVAPLENPNDEIVASLPPSRRRERDVALYGDRAHSVVVRAPRSDASYRVYPRSCVFRANAVVHGPGLPIARATARYNSLVQRMTKRMAADPRLARARRRWTICMTVTGHTFPGPEAVVELVRKRFASLDPDVAGRAGSAGLGRVQELELSLARADTRCRAESGVETIARRIGAEYEQELIDRHPRVISLVY